IIRECEYCEEDWLCGNWTECTINETQTRSCEDLNDCGTEDDKPNLIQECEYIEPCNPFWDCGVYGECNEDGYKIMTCIDLNYCDENNYTINYTKECECEENWLCGNWTSCSPDGNQTRTCEDLNDCGTDDDKPDLVQDCVCEEYWNCTEWTECNEDGNQTRTCEDLNDCGTFDDKPDLIQECDKLVGEISISGPMLVEGTGSLYETYGKAYCNRRGQVLTFNIENSMPNTIDEINFDLFINGEKVNYLGEYAKFPIILRYDSGSIVKTFPEGTYKAHLEFMKSVANKEIKIVIDPLNKITPSNPNKTLKFTFPDEKFDLYVHEIDYNYFLEKLRIRIHRDQIIDECPGIDIEIYVNNEYISSPVFSGMNGLIGNYVLGPSLLPGEHEIKIVIDPFDYIDVVNIENKIYIGNITIE
ncbi:MAG: hypothetical protein ACMXX8_03300, partial [Candidatus Woesearchaeota archaeon]